MEMRTNWQNIEEEQIIKYLSPQSIPNNPAALNPISDKGGDLSERGPASLLQATES